MTDPTPKRLTEDEIAEMETKGVALGVSTIRNALPSLLAEVRAARAARPAAAAAPHWVRCDCGRVEFVAPGPVCARVAEPGGQPIQHTPFGCRSDSADPESALSAEATGMLDQFCPAPRPGGGGKEPTP